MKNKENKKYNFIYIGKDAHKPPVFREQKGKDWIQYGDKNLYPDYLINLYNTSPKHNAIINGKVNYIVGQGFDCVGTMDLMTKTKVQGFISSVGEDSLKELNYKLATDLEIFGGYAVEPIISRGGDKIAELAHIDFSKIRVSKDGAKFFFAGDWSDRKVTEREDFKEFVPFDPENPQENSLIYYKTYRPNLQEYPLPSYIGAIPYIEAEAEIANYSLSNIQNGFSGSWLINFHNGQPTEAEQEYIESMLKKKFTGSDNAGAFMLSFDDGKDRSVDVIPLSDDGKQDKFLNLIAQTGQEIFTGHGVVNPALFGVKESAGLGNNADELRTSSEAFQNRYVTPKQDILEDLYNSVLIFNGLQGCLQIRRTEVITETLSEDVMVQIMTIDELREKAGLPPLEGNQVTGFSQEIDFEAIKAVGYEDKDLTFIKARQPKFNPFEDEEQAFSSEQEFITSLGVSIISILQTNPLTSVDELAKATGRTIEDINNELADLRAEGRISVTDGAVTVEEEVEEEEQVLVVYKYVERPGAPALRTESRDFCKNMLRLSLTHSWTREQIERLNNKMGLSVFRSRGGWYNNPTTGVTTPYCRHIWEQRLVKIKK